MGKKLLLFSLLIHREWKKMLVHVTIRANWQSFVILYGLKQKKLYPKRIMRILTEFNLFFFFFVVVIKRSYPKYLLCILQVECISVVNDYDISSERLLKNFAYFVM